MKHPAKLRLRLRGAAALLALLALAAGAVFALRVRTQAAEWAFEPEPGQVFAAFGNSFAACSSTQLQIYGPEGELCLRAELPQPAPALAASDTRLAVWSAGGESFSVFDAQGGLGSVEAEGELLDLRLRGDMAVAAVMGGEGLGLVTVYDGLLRPVYRWHAQTAWPLAAELSPEGDALAVLAASEAGGQLRLFSLGSEEERARFESPGEYFIDLAWMDGGLCLLSEDRAVFLDEGGAQTGEYRFGSARLRDCAFGGDFALLVLEEAGQVSLVSLDASGGLIAQLSPGRDFVSAEAEKDKIAVLYSDGAAVYNKNLRERGSGAQAAGAQALLLRGDGETLAVFAGAVRTGLA